MDCDRATFRPEQAIDRDQAWRTAMAIAWYVANRSADGMLRDLFGERRAGDPYAAEWLSRFRSRDFAGFFCKLDFLNQRRFIAVVLRAYESDSAEVLARARAHHPEECR